jgi:hypothetical protein
LIKPEPLEAEREGEARDVVGFDLPAELPTSPHLRLENHGDLGPQQAAAEIIRWRDAHPQPT